MGISKYPRFGQRIAPSTLREILGALTPTGILQDNGGRYALLADLDETVWRSASQNDCKLLGNFVMREVQQNVTRLPVMIKYGTLAVISRRIPLRELDLELRTFNALNKRFGSSVPPETQIHELLRAGGFGARCLVDFLASVEFFASRPPETQQLELAVPSEAAVEASPEELPSKIDVEISHYPRPGQRIAPNALRSFLNVSPTDRRLSQIQLSDLDESAWDRFAPELCRKLALAVIDRVKTFAGGLRRNETGRNKLPMPKTNGKPIVLQLERRTYNCLHTRELLDNPSRLAQMTISELRDMPGFGIRCLVDLLSSLESQVSETHAVTPEVVAAAQKLSRINGAGRLRIDDPRFGLELQGLRIRGETLQEICGAIIAGADCPMNAGLFARRLGELMSRIQTARRMTLEVEMLDLLTFEPKARNRSFTVRLLGWDGNGGQTLETIGRDIGVTRERVRQISQHHLDRIQKSLPFLPVLDRAIEAVAANAPSLESAIGTALVEKRLTKDTFKIAGVLNAAEVTGRRCAFIIEEGDGQSYVVPRDDAGITKQILQLARKAISHWGVTTIEDVAAEVSSLLGRPIASTFVTAVVSAQPSFAWLDMASGWFWLKSTARNALLNQVEKILCVCDQVHISELRSGVSRNHRREGFAPPQRVLLALCKQPGAYEVVGNLISANPPLNYLDVLADTERTFVAVFRETGPLVESRKLEQECLARGMNRATFMQYLTYSAIITRFARGVYGLRGTVVQPGMAESLVRERAQSRRVLADYGWLEDGRIFLTYKLSSGMLANGNVSVPASMKQYLSGAHQLHVAGGVPIGRLVVRDSQAWGLGPLFTRRGGDPGDSLRILFDLKTKTAIAELGQTSAEEVAEVAAQSP